MTLIKIEHYYTAMQQRNDFEAEANRLEAERDALKAENEELRSARDSYRESANKLATRVAVAEEKVDALKAENEGLKDQIQMLTDCLNGSSKAKYTAEMYDAVRDNLAAAQKRIAELEDALVVPFGRGEVLMVSARCDGLNAVAFERGHPVMPVGHELPKDAMAGEPITGGSVIFTFDNFAALDNLIDWLQVYRRDLASITTPTA